MKLTMSWSLALLCIFLLSFCSCEKEHYLLIDHAEVTFVDHVHVGNFTLTTRRYSRRDRTRYINTYVTTLKEFNHKYSVYFDFFELLSNMYKPSFVDIHFDNLCEFLEEDTFLGSAIVAAYLKSTPKEKRLKNLNCPIPPGDYVYENMTVPPASIYKHFPFTNGRIYCNVTYLKKDLVLSFNVDMTLK